MSGGWLPKRIVFGNLEGAVLRGRGGKEKEWTDYVQSDVRAFGRAGDWKGKRRRWRQGGGRWIDTVTKGGRRSMAAWRKEDRDAARNRQEKKEANEARKVVTAHGGIEPPKRYRLASLTSRRNSVRAMCTRHVVSLCPSVIFVLLIECVCACVCVFIKLRITVQSGPVILVILCHSH